ncbi:MAG: SLC26A/SulP transporter family protein [Anaerolineaceae bacterium]|nr:SLC26A/SulP transporter family protein [Anaerolineaceae bacterium]
MAAVPEKSALTKVKESFAPQVLLPGLVGGGIVALFEVVLSVSFAALIFAGPLAPFLANGVGLALVGAIVAGVAVSLFTTLPGIVASIQDVPAAILAVIAAALAAQLAGSPEQMVVTVVTAVALTAGLTGLFFLGLGYFRMGRWVRFLPFPVIGGFLGGTGWLLLTGSLGLMTDVAFDWAQLGLFFQVGTLGRWLPGMVFALLFFLARRYSDHFLLMPGFVLGGTLLFYGYIWLSGTPLAMVTAAGWLLGPFPDQSLWLPLTSLDFSQVNWPALAGQAGNFVTIFLVSTLALLLNAGGLELSAGEDIDLNQELRAAGLGNLLAAPLGGLVGFQALSISTLNLKLGARTRLAGVVAALLCGVMLFQGAAVLGFVPKVIVGGLLFYLGLDFLLEWVVVSWFKLPPADSFIILLIVVVIATVGFLQGVFLGLMAAVILFGVNYGRTDVVRHELAGPYVRSRVTRPRLQRQQLKQALAQVHLWQLQGFIFFGTADALLNRIRDRIADHDLPPLSFVVLDFYRVTGLDSTAVFSFQKLQQLADKQNITIVYTGMRDQFQQQLRAALAANCLVRWFVDVDDGLEWCEDALLATAGVAEAKDADLPLRGQLRQFMANDAVVEGLLTYLTRREVVAGDMLMKQGSPPDGLIFVESGQVSALLERPSQEPLRLETMGSGRVVGEMGFYLGQERTASVVADGPGVVYELSRQDLARMEMETPEAAAGLHRLIAHLLAERATHLVETVDALQR